MKRKKNQPDQLSRRNQQKQLNQAKQLIQSNQRNRPNQSNQLNQPNQLNHPVRSAGWQLRPGTKKLFTYVLAVLVAAGTTHAMILPAMGVDMHELVGEADVVKAADVWETADVVEAAGVWEAADVVEATGVWEAANVVEATGEEMDVSEATAAPADDESSADLDTGETTAASAGNVDVAEIADGEVPVDGGLRQDVEAGTNDIELPTGSDSTGASENSNEANVGEEQVDLEETVAETAVKELYAETENFTVTVFCNADGGAAGTDPLLMLEEAEENSKTFQNAKAALAELRREENESYSPDTENLAVLDMQLEDIGFGDPVKINIRVRQVPDEISSEEFVQTAEIYRLESPAGVITEEMAERNDEDSTGVATDTDELQRMQSLEVKDLQTTDIQTAGMQTAGKKTNGMQTAGFRLEQGELSADVKAELQENEPFSLVISWAAEEQEASPDFGELISTAGTEIEDTTAIGISEDDAKDDEGMDSEVAADEALTTEETMEKVLHDATDSAEYSGAAGAVANITDDTANATDDNDTEDETENSSTGDQQESDYNGYELPATGGPGQKPYRVAGGALSAAALIALQITGPENKRTERRHKKGP